MTVLHKNECYQNIYWISCSFLNIFFRSFAHYLKTLNWKFSREVRTINFQDEINGHECYHRSQLMRKHDDWRYTERPTCNRTQNAVTSVLVQAAMFSCGFQQLHSSEQLKPCQIATETIQGLNGNRIAREKAKSDILESMGRQVIINDHLNWHLYLCQIEPFLSFLFLILTTVPTIF